MTTSGAIALTTRGYFVTRCKTEGGLTTWAVAYRRTTNGAKIAAGYVIRDDATGRRLAFTDAGYDLARGSEPWLRRIEAVRRYEDALRSANAS